MKKYLLSALLGVFTLFGVFASAESLTVIYDQDEFGDWNYIPSSITFSDTTRLDLSSFTNYSCEDYCTLNFSNVDSDNYISCEFNYSNSSEVASLWGYNVDSTDGYCIFDAGTYNTSYSDGISFNSVTLNYGGGSAGTEGTNPDVSLGGQIIENGTSALSPIITSIFSVMGEFIPYVVYIGIGILLCTLGFTAIKWLMNWLSGKIKKYFR